MSPCLGKGEGGGAEGGGDKHIKIYSNCIRKVRSSMPSKLRVIDFLSILWVIKKRYPAAGSVDQLDQCRYIKIQPKTIHLSTRLWGITTEFVGFYSSKPHTEVYCITLNFNISKLVCLKNTDLVWGEELHFWFFIQMSLNFHASRPLSIY